MFSSSKQKLYNGVGNISPLALLTFFDRAVPVETIHADEGVQEESLESLAV
jgi:hypothetical protein